MNIIEARQHVFAYADGELAAQARREFESAMRAFPQLAEEVEQARALRRCLNRVLLSNSLPAGLEARVRENLRRRYPAPRGATRLLWPVVGVAAAIALLMLVFQFRGGESGGVWSAPAAAMAEVATSEFAHVHERCACRERHGPFEYIGHTCPADAQRAYDRNNEAYAVAIPDLIHSGYELDGICECFGDSSISVVHAYYRFPGRRPEIVSIFSLDRHVKLKEGRPLDVDCFGRNYEVGESEGVTVLKWNGKRNSFAVCAYSDADTLLNIAETINIARAIFDTAERYASAAWESGGRAGVAAHLGTAAP